jgi:DNA-binding MarR family transcriptional regulator
MKNDDERNLYLLLIRASIPVKQAFIRAGELFGLTHMQLFTLCLINKDGETPMNSITCILGCDASNVTGLVEKLVATGFIKRSESPQDRRSKLITLTEKGKRTREHIMRGTADGNVDLLSALDTNEKATLAQLLTKVLESCPTTKKAR